MSNPFWCYVKQGLAANRPTASKGWRGKFYWAQDSGLLSVCLESVVAGTYEWIYVAVAAGPSAVKRPVRCRVTTPTAYTATTRAGTGQPTYLTENVAAAGFGLHDGVTLVAGERFLLADGTQYAGIYRLDVVGSGAVAWVATREPDFDVTAEVIANSVVPVEEGTVSGNKLYILTTDNPIVLDTTVLAWAVAALTVANESAHTHAAGAFTGTAPASAAVNVTTGSGYATAGQVVTTTDNQTCEANDYAGCWFIAATKPPCLIVSHPAAAAAPVALTVFGEAPATTPEDYRILRAPTPAGSVAVSAAGSAHTHSVS